MMTMAQFLATHRKPNAIVLPPRLAAPAAQRSRSARSDAPAMSNAPGMSMPARLRRGPRGAGGSGKKN